MARQGASAGGRLKAVCILLRLRSNAVTGKIRPAAGPRRHRPRAPKPAASVFSRSELVCRAAAPALMILINSSNGA
jgi:hypothetical protein